LFGYLEELTILDSQAVEKVISEVNEEMQLEIREDHNASMSSSPMRYSDVEQGSFEERLLRLEHEVSALQNSSGKEKALLRKAILIQLDMDSAYDNR
jgi:hypothetical protein